MIPRQRQRLGELERHCQIAWTAASHQIVTAAMPSTHQFATLYRLGSTRHDNDRHNSFRGKSEVACTLTGQADGLDRAEIFPRTNPSKVYDTDSRNMRELTDNKSPSPLLLVVACLRIERLRPSRIESYSYSSNRSIDGYKCGNGDIQMDKTPPSDVNQQKQSGNGMQLGVRDLIGTKVINVHLQ
ncbi:Poly [ADP-ribose] polymerase 2 [Fusarium oxysporum f. sp. albedinis]|nr:Poly [ADP-ribose] polymerase 2 [Fusarium oxysporum f. sp. albedinis]